MTQLSIIVPCYNECTTILQLIEKVRSSPIDRKEIVVVDDGSVDGTRELLHSLELSSGVFYNPRACKSN